jgi:hypothetical protein
MDAGHPEDDLRRPRQHRRRAISGSLAGLPDRPDEVSILPFTLLATAIQPALDRVQPQALCPAGVGQRDTFGGPLDQGAADLGG